MSVERLINSSQAAREFTGIVELREKEKGHDRSPVFIVASTYIEQGSEGLRRLNPRINEIKGSGEFDELAFRRLAIQEQDSLILNHAAVILGVCIIAIENMWGDAVFREEDMIGRFNSAVGRTIVPEWEHSGEKTIPLFEKEWKKIDELRKIDPSFSVIIARGMDMLPEGIKRLLEQSGAAPVIRGKLLIPFNRQTLELIKKSKG